MRLQRARLILIFKVVVFGVFLSGIVHAAGLSNYDQYGNARPCTQGGVNSKYFICNDQTMSFVQPKRTSSHEGLCGQTAAANLLAMHCRGVLIDPVALQESISDLTPGTMPATLKAGLNSHFNQINARNERRFPTGRCSAGKWNSAFEDSSVDYLKSLSRALGSARAVLRTRTDGTRIWRSPVAAVVAVPSGMVNTLTEAHWVTVVDVENQNDPNRCAVFVNTYGTQYKIQCDEFVMLTQFPVRVYGLGSQARVTLSK